MLAWAKAEKADEGERPRYPRPSEKDTGAGEGKAFPGKVGETTYQELGKNNQL